MSKYHGSLIELQAIVAACNVSGAWLENTTSRFYSFRANTGEILNWWPSTGTVNFQGNSPEQFRALFLSYAPACAPEPQVWRSCG
jgi:hypothetical protein